MAETLQSLEARYNRLARNGKNGDDSGVLRKLQRRINRLKKGIVIS